MSLTGMDYQNFIEFNDSKFYFKTDILVIFIERAPINPRKSNLQLNKMDEGAFRNVSIRNDFKN